MSSAPLIQYKVHTSQYDGDTATRNYSLRVRSVTVSSENRLRTAFAASPPLEKRFIWLSSGSLGLHLDCNSTIHIVEDTETSGGNTEFIQKVDRVFVLRLCCPGTQHRARETLVELPAAAFSAPWRSTGASL